MVKKALIYGAGAVGRGFLAPMLSGYGYEIGFVEKSRGLRDLISANKRYRAAETSDNGYVFREVAVSGCFEPYTNYDVEDYDIVFTAVGPNNCLGLAKDLGRARAVVSCENERTIPARLKEASGNPGIFFGIPDVISSNTAPERLLRMDPLMAVSEAGILVVEEGPYTLPDCVIRAGPEDLERHWACKLYIHNAPHAVLAYLGWLKRYRYVHEAMGDPEIADVVEGAMGEIVEALVKAGMASREFAEDYKLKELKRFKNVLLYDTIARVAREPLRKLSRDDRLAASLRLCERAGIRSAGIAKGIKAALEYDNPDDAESMALQALRKKYGDRAILEKHCGIEPDSEPGMLVLGQDISGFRGDDKIPAKPPRVSFTNY